MSAHWIHDLNSGAPADPIVTDVCILGAGPVGLTTARALAAAGHRVTILEIGARTPCIATESPGVHFDRRVYRGATVGRAFGLGGTSALWGGQLLPVRPADLLARPQVQASAWPLAYAEIEPHFKELQNLLGVGTDGFDLESTRGSRRATAALDFTDWVPRHSRWLAFGRRNIATAWMDHFDRESGVEVWLNATVGAWSVTGSPGDRTVAELTAQSPGGHAVRVRPCTLVIASGALESARTVLELNAQAGPLSRGVNEYAGRFLHDHLSLRMARARIIDAAAFEKLFAPFFEGGTMRSLRMELAPDILEGAKLPALYAHFLAEASDTSGFSALRDCLRFAQRRDFRQALGAASRMPRGLPDIAQIMYARFVKKSLSFPPGSDIFLQIDFEQAPKYENRVYLGKSEHNARPPLHIDWDVGDEAPRVARTVRRYLEEFWRRNRLNKIAELEYLDLGEDKAAWNRNIYDIYHPAGTARMAVDPAEGVVDPNLKIHGTHNAYVVGSAVFPSMGAANPTFTAMALGLRLAQVIGRPSTR